MSSLSRRDVFNALGVLGIAELMPRIQVAPAQPDLSWPPAVTGISAAYPTHDAFVVKNVVGASHRSLDLVKAAVSRQPSLAKAAWDWGYGDWETALGAAAHTGQREIAEYLIEHGAPPTIFSATMLGQLDVVKAMVAAQPGIQRLLGPHNIPLLSHARAGGPTAAPVVAYLESLGGAAGNGTEQPTTPELRASLVGRYVFGAGPRDAFIVDNEREMVGLMRVGAGRVILGHLGGLVFAPRGAEGVRIRFTGTELTIADPEVLVVAKKVTSVP